MYKTERYLRRCIDSILNQNSGYKVQCIVIDDGSPDGSGRILAEYQGIQGVVIVRQENRGVSGARNAGLDLAAAKYVMFVDSDDRLEKSAVKNLMDAAFRFNADIVAGSYRTVSESGRPLQVKRYAPGPIQPEGNLHGQPWGKVYKADGFAHLRFPEGYWYEDSIFAQIVWPLVKNVHAVSEIVYEYTINRSGIVRSGIRRAKSLDSLYITAQLMKDREKYALSPTPENFEYFMRMVRMTYRRTCRCSGAVAKGIFVIQCELFQRYEGVFAGEGGRLQTALRNRDYRKYLKYIDSQDG